MIETKECETNDWRIDWQEEICVYEDEIDDCIVERLINRHPFRCEYTEIFESNKKEEIRNPDVSSWVEMYND